jgi:Ca-activated chloride channel family protein
VSFGAPVVLLGLLLLPALLVLYLREQHRRAGARRAFVTAPLTASVASRHPGWRRHAPMVVFAAALVTLIAAAARPERSLAVPVRGATIMLANDISDSMKATDVTPSRLGAAQLAALRFVAETPASARIGQVEFARNPTLLQSPTANHALAENAIRQLRSGGGGTAIGRAIQIGLSAIATAPKINGKRPAGAIILLSDGSSNVGISPLQAATEARRQHVRIDTIAIGTPTGTIADGRGHQVPVPVSPEQLAQIAAASGGHAYTAAGRARASAIYAQLATQLGHKHVIRPITASVAGAGLILLLLGSGMSLFWFARLA